MTPPLPDAVGSYGAEAIEWIEAAEKKRLRWWQRLAITRQLEHREDGSLCWRTIVESCPRRAGKSVRIRGLALWRMAHADLIGEVQTVVHCGNDLPICREIQRGAWRWAEAQGWVVTRSNGKEALEDPDGSRWLVRSQDGVYGWDAGLAVVDEAWDVKPDTVSEGLEPAMLERLWAQLHLTSTAHRRATSLMRSRIADALAVDDGETLLLLWGARADDDPGDPAVWRAASPHWSQDRARMIAAKYAKALVGEADPEADDLDPMAGFTAQYLNMWRLTPAARERGHAFMTDHAWGDLVDEVPAGPPYAAAIESWFAEGVSVALAWRVGTRAVVAVGNYPDLAAAASAVKVSQFRRIVTVGASLVEDPALRGLRCRAGQGRAGVSVQELQRLIGEDAVRHDGGEHLSGQVLAARTLPGADGPRMTSAGRADAIKAAQWAVSDCRKKSVGRPRIVVAV
ncbi:HNH endonuclease [Kribbella sp. CA-293567]|uniref:HNH endonuclease n=1 Tax=Kribbella sp. CA-293567 TaxID=3002436 RepID=UPI0022DE0642|nr:HNH endonuclease [Kribbella sp. CA-293567]WBQ02948.1 HNH endonuclease [Kribbella sp. CA-293567]